MNISVCITVLNEESTIGKLLDSLLSQTKKADEIIIVDGGSKDNTFEIIKHYQKKDGSIKLILDKCSRAQGRNIGIEAARGGIIALTDAGCIAEPDWLENLTAPFIHPEVDIAAGFYKMTGESSFQKAVNVFLGVTPRKFGIKFLPSARSMAFRKEVWERIGGFPERNKNTAEDTDFNYQAVRLGMKYAAVKNAQVEWGMPETLKEALKKFFDYAKGDASLGIWWHPAKMFSSHNIKVFSIFARYLLFLALLIYSFKNPLSLLLFVLLISFYSIWAFRKVYLEVKEVKAGLWGIAIQFSSDLAVMAGFISGFTKSFSFKLK